MKVSSDSRHFIESLRSLYRRLEISQIDDVPDVNVLNVALVTQPSPEQGEPALIINSAIWHHPDATILEDLASEVILSQALSRVTTHYLIHAAVVSLNNKGVIIVAESGHGKTTLSIKLMLSGFKFLTDEIAALGRFDRLIQPFPRSLRVKPGTLELLGLSQLENRKVTWGDKILLDVEDIVEGSLGEAASIDYIFFVKDPQQRDIPEHSQELGILINRLDENTLSELLKLDNIKGLRQEQVFGYPLLKFHTEHRMKVLSCVEKICQKHGILILDVYKRVLTQPKFDAPVQVEPLPPSQAALELLRQFQPGHKSRLIQEEHSGSLTRMYMELTRLISRSKCHRISPGPVDEMAGKMSTLITS